MASFKIKPLSAQSIRLVVLNADGTEAQNEVIMLGEWYDVDIPEGGTINLTAEPPEVPSP